MLHCAARMNFLSYLYERRQDIALSLGLIDEIPIAMCQHDYDFDKGLTIVTHDTNESRLPSPFLNAREIILFCQNSMINVDPRPEISITNPVTHLRKKKYTPPEFPIFHPPA